MFFFYVLRWIGGIRLKKWLSRLLRLCTNFLSIDVKQQWVVMLTYQRKRVIIFGVDSKWRKFSFIMKEIVNEVKFLKSSWTKTMYIGFSFQWGGNLLYREVSLQCFHFYSWVVAKNEKKPNVQLFWGTIMNMRVDFLFLLS